MPKGLGLTMALRSVSALLEKVGHSVWRADALAGAISTAGVVASGHHDLDAQLPGGGWPVGALCELLQEQGGQLEWRLLLPALRGLPHAVVLVAPPWVPYGPGLQAQGLSTSALIWVQVQSLADRLWAAEQLLHSDGVSALLLWLPKVRSESLRRLHMAAHAHAKLLFVMRLADAQTESSPAVLRLLVQTHTADDLLHVQILKRRGPPLVSTLHLPARPAALAVLLAIHQAGTWNVNVLGRTAAAV